jgi:hypothetical protein
MSEQRIPALYLVRARLAGLTACSTSGRAEQIADGEACAEIPSADWGVTDVTTAEGGVDFSTRRVSRGSIVGDNNNDGDLDIFIATLQDEYVLPGNDLGSEASWTTIGLVGRSARDPFGTRVRVEAGGRTWASESRCPSGYLGQGDPRLHFGLGEDVETVNRVLFTWPGGSHQALTQIPAGQFLRIEEKGEPVPVTSRRDNCHRPPFFTEWLVSDVGTGGLLDTPYLLDIGSSPPYLHDGRALTASWEIYDVSNTLMGEPWCYAMTSAISADGLIWIATDQGLSSFDSQSWHIWRWRENTQRYDLRITSPEGEHHTTAQPSGPADNTIYSIDLDEGDVRLATASGPSYAIAATRADARGDKR